MEGKQVFWKAELVTKINNSSLELKIVQYGFEK